MATATTAGIKVITEPAIYTLARTVTNVDENARFLDDVGTDWRSDATSYADELVEIAGRNCYQSWHPAKQRPGGNPAYIRHILEVGHGSVLEHASWTFLLTGVSRSLTHELVRHRAGMSYSQLSQRFVDSSDVAFVVPPALVTVHKLGEMGRFDLRHSAYGAWAEHCRASLDAYRELLGVVNEYLQESSRKEIHEAARSVLPNCTETRIVVTGNGRSWRHFLHLRGSEGADAEIRRLACTLAPILKADAPAIFGDVVVTAAGTVEVGHPC